METTEIKPIITDDTTINNTSITNNAVQPSVAPPSLPKPSLAEGRSRRNTRAPARFEDEIPVTQPPPVIEPPKKQKRRRHKTARDLAMRDLGRWKPADDLALILAAQQTNSLQAVHKGVKFSCKFTLQEIEDRWYALLYYAPIQRVAMAAMRQLSPDIVAKIHAKTLFSEEEENTLKTVTQPKPSLQTFRQLLDDHPDVFQPHRRENHLLTHWLAMKYHNLLSHDQTRRDELPTFNEVEETVDKDILHSLTDHIASNFNGQSVLSNLKDDPVHQELMVNARRVKREIRKLENEIPKWQALVDSIKVAPQSDFDDNNHPNLAVLRGRHIRYLMILKQITFGRCTKDTIVDVDLSLEGPASKISRKQGMIELQPNGDFVIANTGKRPFYVDSKPVSGNGNCTVIHNNSVVEICGLRFVFLINIDLIAKMKNVNYKE